jgi:hypothetical protein
VQGARHGGVVPVTWTPILDGDRHRRASELLRRLADELLVEYRVGARGPDPTQKLAALLIGLPGQAIAHAYLARCGLGDAHDERAGALLEIAVGDVGELINGGLLRGFAGPAFALEHLYGDVEDTDDVNEPVDAALLDELALRPDDLPLEYMHGLAGRAVYARERLPRPSGAALYHALAQRLIDAAERDDAGARWRTEEGHDLRVAWGMIGIVAVLAACPVHPGAAPVARDAMRWIWSLRQPASTAMFPIAADKPASPLAGWCLGDIGLSAVLWRAACALGDVAWQARWLGVLCETASRPTDPEQGLSLCHGAPGVGHIYARAYHHTGDARLRDAALAWFDCALDLASADDAALDLPTGVLDGLAGIALCLAAATSDVEPAWDRLFLLS